MNFGYPAIFATTCLLLVGCSTYATSLSVQSAMPESIETNPTEEADSNPLAVALSFITPTPEPTDTVLQALQNWQEPDPAPTKKNSAPVVPLHVPMLPTISPDLLGNVAIRPNNILHGDRSKARIALTFDTGAGTPIVRIILHELRQANVHATFFIVGNWARENPDVVSEIARDGHDLANHSWNHPNFTQLSDDQMVAQVEWTEDAVRRATGCTTRPFFRAPFGSLNNHVLQVLGEAGFESIFWSAHGGDWLPGMTTESVRATVVKNTGNGGIIVLHSSVPETAQAVPHIINDLHARGFELVRLSELLASDPSHPLRAACKPRS